MGEMRMLIDLTDVLQTEGKTWETTASIDMDAFTSRLGSFPIISKSPVSFYVRNEGQRKLLLKGETTVKVLIPCARCLKDVENTIQLEFEKELDMNVTPQERELALDEQVFLDGYNLDVDKLVYGEILLNWPMKVLCRDDCKGICSRCGADLNLGTCSCDSTDLDPRMAKIRDIFSKFKEV